MSEKVDLTVSIVSFNTRDILEECLHTIFDTAGNLSLQVIVVDNNSFDHSAEMVREQFPLVQVITNRENRLFSPAQNQALRLAQGRYSLILNPDVKLLPETLQTMINFMDEHPDVGASSCLFRNPDGSVGPSCWHYTTPQAFLLDHKIARLFWPNSRLRAKTYMEDWDRQSLREIDVICGAFMFVRTEVLKQVGYFDESIRFTFTDDDLSRKIHTAGWKICHVPNAEVVHHLGASWKKNHHLFVRKILIADAKAYYTKYHGRLSGVIIELFLWIDFIPRSIFLTLIRGKDVG